MNQSPQETHQAATIITNKYANRGRAEIRGGEVAALLRSLGCEVEHHQPLSADQSREIAKKAIADGRHLVGVGGDGLIHHLVQECAETSATLGIVPAGTGNDFAYGLGLSVDLQSSSKAAIGKAQPVDLLRLEDNTGLTRYGTTIATAGFSAAVNIRAEQMAWPRGSSRYTLATLRELRKLKRYDFQMTLDGIEMEGRCLMIAIANTPAFGGGMQIAPSAVAWDGKADIVVIRDTSALNLLRMLPKTFKGKHIGHPAVEILRAERVSINLTNSGNYKSCALRSDGEDVGSLPQTVTVVPGGLHVAGLSPPMQTVNESKEEPK